MPFYEVEYSYDEPVFGVYSIEASSMEKAETIAENRLLKEYPALANARIDCISEEKRIANNG